MAAADENDDSKPFDPTPRRLQRAREEGDTIRSEDMQSAAASIGFLLIVTLIAGWVIQKSALLAQRFLSHPHDIHLADEGSGALLVSRTAHILLPIFSLLLGPALFVLLWLTVSRGWSFAPSKLSAKRSRISIPHNFKQKFGYAGLVDFAKKSAKLFLIALTLGLFLKSRADWLSRNLWFEPKQNTAVLLWLMRDFLIVTGALLLLFGCLDFLWQRFEFQRRNRMSHKDMSDEMKESEGDPYIKADRRRRAQDVATRNMLRDVPSADVVIVNPSHYAVALKWDRKRGAAPKCIAKGRDEIAARIKTLALDAGVPIHRDPPTARRLYATLEIGQEIQPAHFAAVAAAIRFSDAMRERAGFARNRGKAQRPPL